MLHETRVWDWRRGKNRSREESDKALEHSHMAKMMWGETSVENDQMVD